MRFAICEDNSSNAQLIMQYMQKIEDSTARLFKNGKDFLCAVREKQEFDIILLDIELPDMLGLEIVNALQESLPHADIVFMSSYPQYVTSAFTLRVSQFFLKPISEYLFLTEIRRMIKRREIVDLAWDVQTKGGVRKVLASEIIYIEAYHRSLRIQTGSGCIEAQGKLADAMEALSGMDFARSHQGYLINLKHIRSITRDTVVCSANDSDYKVPLSHRLRTDFLNTYTTYLAQ